MIRVTVLDKNGKPMMPTKASRARRWLKEGKAKVIHNDLKIMRCSLRDCLICRCPPSSLTYGKNWSQDATNQTHNSSRHRIIDYGVGLLAGLVESDYQ